MYIFNRKSENDVSKRRKELVNNFLDIILLKETLSGNYGYQLMKKLKYKYEYNPGNSRVYPQLKKLEKQGYLDCEKREVNGRLRKIYKLNSKGILFLLRMFEECEKLVEKIENNPILNWYKRAYFRNRV